MTGSSITGSGAVMSLLGMNRIIDIDPVRRIARVEPGVRIGDLNRELSQHGLLFAPDPTSENDATIGGAIACNASGARTLRFADGPDEVHRNAIAKWELGKYGNYGKDAPAPVTRGG